MEIAGLNGVNNRVETEICSYISPAESKKRTATIQCIVSQFNIELIDIVLLKSFNLRLNRFFTFFFFPTCDRRTAVPTGGAIFVVYVVNFP